MPPLLSELFAVGAGLAAAAFWGAGDFAGGLASRRGNVFGIVTISMGLGLLLLVAMALILGEPLPPVTDLAWGVAAGVPGGLSLAALYVALGAGQMGVAAPLAAVLGAAVPVLFTAATSGLPGPVQLAGFAIAGAAVWLLTRSEPTRVKPAGLGLALFAGCGIGLFLILLGQAGSTAVFWPLAAARGTAFILIAAIFLFRRVAMREGAGPVPLRLAALAGVGDVLGNTFFVLAAQAGRLDAAAVLSSLYPVSTILLARFLLDERVTRSQALGIAAALAAVVLIAA